MLNKQCACTFDNAGNVLEACGAHWDWHNRFNRVVEHNPIPMLLTCPMCSKRHIDKGEFETKPHHTHACQYCGHVWRPAIVPTVGVQFLPGFKDVSENPLKSL